MDRKPIRWRWRCGLLAWALAWMVPPSTSLACDGKPTEVSELVLAAWKKVGAEVGWIHDGVFGSEKCAEADIVTFRFAKATGRDAVEGLPQPEGPFGVVFDFPRA